MGIGRSKKKTAETSTSSLGDESGAEHSASPPTTRESEVAGSMVGRYKLLQRIGEGGFGVVYMAEQREPIVRRVALKIIKAGMDSKQVITRFEAERQALALMDHPNIAKVLDGGATENGRPYFVMELVRGLPITLFCDREKFDTRQRLELFMDVCAAVQHAHQKGIIHRDLKPSNILVGIADGKPVAKVIDFGIAKATQQQLTDKTLFTQFEQFIGTPLYISPEQAQLSAVDIDTRSDIYSLGVILYELLTGMPPLDPKQLLAAGLDEMRRMIRETDALKPSTRFGTIENDEMQAIAAARRTEPRKLGLFIKGELEWIVLKALEKERARRYDTATAFREDLRRFLTNEPVSAAAPSSLYKFRKFARRNKGALAAGSAVALALLGGALVSNWQAVEARHARDGEAKARQTADQRAREADGARAVAQQRLEMSARADWVMGKNYLVSGGSLRPDAFAYLARSCENDPSASLAAETAVLALNVVTDDHGLSLQLPVFADHVASLDFSPDGSRVVAGRVVLDSTTGKPAVALRADDVESAWGLDEEVMDSRFSRDGSRIVTSTTSGQCLVWDSKTGRLVSRLNEPTPSARVLPSRRQVRGVKLPERRPWATYRAEFHPDGTRILTSGQTRWAGPTQHFVEWPGAARVWDANTGSLLFTLEGHTADIVHACYSMDGTRIVTAAKDETVKVWDAESGSPLLTLEGHSGGAVYAEIDPRGKFAVTVSADHAVRIWDLSTGKLRYTHAEHMQRVTAAHFSPDGCFVLTASEDGQVFLLRVEPPITNGGQRYGVYRRKLESAIAEACFSPDGRYCALSSPDGQTWIMEIRDGGIRQELAALPPVRFSPNGMRLAEMAMGGAQDGWGVAPRSGILLTIHSRAMMTKLEGEFRTPVWSSDKTRIHGIALNGREIWTIDCKNTSVTDRLRRNSGVFDDLVIEPGTSRVQVLELRAPRPGIALIRDLPSGVVQATISTEEVASERIRHGRFSPDGRFVATVSATPPKLRLWNADDGKPVVSITEDVDPEGVPQFSPDGAYVACGVSDTQWGVWNARSGELITRGDGVFREFSCIGDRFVTTADHTATIRESRSGKSLLSVAHGEETTAEGASFDGPDGDGENAPRKVTNARFSSDGSYIVTSSKDRSARIWQTRSGEELWNLSGHEGTVFDARFSPDCSRVFTTSLVKDKGFVMSVWDLKSGQRVLSLGGMSDFRISPDGTQIAEFGREGVVFLETLGQLDRVPNWWPRFLELLGDARLDETGVVDRLTTAERQECTKEVDAALRSDKSRLGAMARWVLAPADDRSVSPWDLRTPRTFADSLIIPSAMPANLQRACEIDPTHPLIELALSRYPAVSRLVSTTEEADNLGNFLRIRGLERLPDDPRLKHRVEELLDDDAMGRNPEFAKYFFSGDYGRISPADRIGQFMIRLLSSGDTDHLKRGTRFLVQLLDDENRFPDWPDFLGFDEDAPGKNALALGALLLICDDREQYIELCQRYADFMDRRWHKQIHRFVRLCMLPSFSIPEDLRKQARELSARMISENPDFGFGWGQLAQALSCYRSEAFEESVRHADEAAKEDVAGLRMDPVGLYLAETIKTLSLYQLGRVEDPGKRFEEIRKGLAAWKKENPGDSIYHVACSVEYLLGEARELGIDWEQKAE